MRFYTSNCRVQSRSILPVPPRTYPLYRKKLQLDTAIYENANFHEILLQEFEIKDKRW